MLDCVLEYVHKRSRLSSQLNVSSIDTYPRPQKNMWKGRGRFDSRSAMRVGIVGAGISGVVAGAHLKSVGIDITVFERSSQAGGVW